MNINSICLLFVFSISLSSVISTEITNEFVVLFISQSHIYILSQIHNTSTFIPPEIPLLYTHSYASTIPNWYAIYPILQTILNQYVQMKWLFICEPETRFNLNELLDFARKNEDLYMGHGLYDSEPSIIHHFSLDFKNPYPDFASGVLISRNILTKFTDRLTTYTKTIDFIIDIKFEFNQLINELISTKFLDRPDLFCIKHRHGCLTWYDGQSDYLCPRKDLQINDLYFGIKTFVDYHSTRLPWLKKTWLNDQFNYHFYTNRLNTTLNKRFIVNNVNTIRGHCHKTFSILHSFYTNQTKLNYLIIVDDDTLLSSTRLLRVIRCFMLTNDHPLVLGERYGYGEYYAYPTGGSGMIFNRPAVREIINNCQCPSADTPDDMFLGLCLQRLGLPLIHIPELHQAQPNAYSKDWLGHQKAISFHKFDGINVEDVYRHYLHEDLPMEMKSHDEF